MRRRRVNFCASSEQFCNETISPLQAARLVSSGLGAHAAPVTSPNTFNSDGLYLLGRARARVAFCVPATSVTSADFFRNGMFVTPCNAHYDTGKIVDRIDLQRESAENRTI